MKLTLRVIGLCGLIFFALLFYLTYGVPTVVEESAKNFVKHQIEKEIKEKYHAAAESSVAENAIKIAEKLGFEEESIRQDLENQLPEKIASVLASMCGYDCEKKKAMTQSITNGMLDRIASIQVGNFNLEQIIKDKYVDIVTSLKRDLRIFLGSNAVVFTVLVLISLLKPNATAHLFIPGILLLISTVASCAIYIFGQDWFYTIIYNDYMGFAYSGYIAVIFAFLMDVVFNRGRVTTEIINGLLNAIGSALSVAPC